MIKLLQEYQAHSKISITNLQWIAIIHQILLLEILLKDKENLSVEIPGKEINTSFNLSLFGLKSEDNTDQIQEDRKINRRHSMSTYQNVIISKLSDDEVLEKIFSKNDCPKKLNNSFENELLFSDEYKYEEDPRKTHSLIMYPIHQAIKSKKIMHGRSNSIDPCDQDNDLEDDNQMKSQRKKYLHTKNNTIGFQ